MGQTTTGPSGEDAHHNTWDAETCSYCEDGLAIGVTADGDTICEGCRNDNPVFSLYRQSALSAGHWLGAIDRGQLNGQYSDEVLYEARDLIAADTEFEAARLEYAHRAGDPSDWPE